MSCESNNAWTPAFLCLLCSRSFVPCSYLPYSSFFRYPPLSLSLTRHRRVMSAAVSSTSTSQASKNVELLTEMDPADWKVVSKLPGNDACIDCHAKYPEWGSINLGILVCTRCCSGHRSLGTHISRVRSIRMDSWTEEQVKFMKAGGNRSCQEWFDKNGGVPIRSSSMSSHKSKYDNEIAKMYIEVLKARVEGRKEPISLKDVKRKERRWNKPKEWQLFQYILPNGKDQKSIVQKLQTLSSSSDFWLMAYVMALVAWSTILFVAWTYRYI